MDAGFRFKGRGGSRNFGNGDIGNNMRKKMD